MKSTSFPSSSTKRAFVGFEAFRTEDNVDFSSPVYNCSTGAGGEAFVLPFRALLTKRDAITRLKALAELEAAYTAATDMQTVRDTLPHFAYLYTRILQRDNDKRIRSGASKLIKLLATLVPKAMVNRFDTFGPDWLLACFDLDRDSSLVSLQALNALEGNANMTSPTILSSLYKFIRQRNPDEKLVAFSDEESVEDALERSSRVRIQALRALAFLFERSKTRQEFDEMEERSNWFKFLLASEEEGGPNARIGAYRVLELLSQHGDGQLSAQVWKLVFRIVGEKHFKAMGPMLNALQQVASTHASEFWANPDFLKKGFLPELLRFVRRMPVTRQTSLLPLLRSMPGDEAGGEFASFRHELIPALLEISPFGFSASRLALECVEHFSEQEEMTQYFWQVVSRWWSSTEGEEGEEDELCFAAFARLASKYAEDETMGMDLTPAMLLRACKHCKDKQVFCRFFYDALVRELVRGESPTLLLAAKPHLEDFAQFLVPGVVKSIDFAAALCACNAAVCFEALLPRYPLVDFLERTREVDFASKLLGEMLEGGSDIGEDETLLRRHLLPADRIKRANKFVAQAQQEIAEHFSFSLKTFAALQEYDEVKHELVYKLLELVFTPNAQVQLSTVEEEETVSKWLERAVATAERFSVLTRGDCENWSKLCAACPSVPFSPGVSLPMRLVCEYLDTGLHPVSVLRSKLGISSNAQFFHWVFLQQHPADGKVSVSPKFRAERRAQQETLETNWFFDLLAVVEMASNEEEEVFPGLEQVLQEFVPDSWLVDSITERCLAGLDNKEEEEDASSSLALVRILLQRRHEMGITERDAEIQAKLSAKLFAALELCETSKALGDSQTVEEKGGNQQAREGEHAELRVGQVVTYLPKSVSCTIVDKHSDGERGFYYTVRYWAKEEGYSKEVQTTRDRLELAPQAAEESEAQDAHKRAQLMEIQKALQRARSAQDKQEIIRLMKLAQELEIKPKDTAEAKQEAMERRRAREQEFLKTSQAEDSEAVCATTTAAAAAGEAEMSKKMERGLEILYAMQAWRNSNNVFPLLPSELAAIARTCQHVFSRTFRIRTFRQVTLLCTLFALGANRVAGENEPEAAILLQHLAVRACELRNPSFFSIYHANTPSLWKETINNRLLAAFLDGEEEDAFKRECEPILAKLRFSALLVHDLFPRLLQELLRSKSLAVFSILFRFPNTSEPLLPDSALARKFEQQDEDAETMLLIWLLVLKRIQVAKSQPGVSLDLIQAWLKQNDLLFHVLDQISSALAVDSAEEDVKVDWWGLTPEQVAAHALFETTRTLPALVREWWCDHVVGRLDRELVLKYVQQSVTPGLIRSDLRELARASSMFDPSEFQLKLSTLGKSVTLVSLKDDCVLEMQITFPDAYPLFPVQVECVKNIGVKPEKWKRWALQIVQLLNKRSGSLLDAIQIWKRNLDKEFEGIEPCPICYSVLQANDSSLPRLTCKTCKNCFHGLCLSTWFTTSHQSLCPLCKQSFMA